jgi:hypothetical protein
MLRYVITFNQASPLRPGRERPKNAFFGDEGAVKST